MKGDCYQKRFDRNNCFIKYFLTYILLVQIRASNCIIYTSRKMLETTKDIKLRVLFHNVA
jgi:hypothetical protein